MRFFEFLSEASIFSRGTYTFGHKVKVAAENKEVKIAIEKIAKLRLFSDEDGKMNLDIQTVSGEILVVSQFTLYANTQKGNRPSFIEAARPEQAIPLYDFFLKELAKFVPVQAGKFGADMQVELINDGPVTMQLEF